MALHNVSRLLLVLSAMGFSSALSRWQSPARPPNAQAQAEIHEAPPISYNNKTTLSFLFKRDLSCTFNNALTNYCDATAYCCWKFMPGADNNAQGAFCCPNDQEHGGGCCGNKCCNYGWYCDWADSFGNAKCTPDASTGTGVPTIVSTVTNFQTLTDTTTATAYITLFDTVYETDVQTNVEIQTNVQIHTQTQVATQTIVQSITVLETVVSTAQITTTNSNGQTIVQTNVQTLTLATVSVSVSAVAAPAQTSNNASCTGINKDPTPIGAIVGGAIGGAALLALAAVFIFAAGRRGWFDKRNPDGVAGVPPPVQNPPPVMAAPKVDSTPQPVYMPQQGYVQPAPYNPQEQRRTMSPVPAYEADGRGIQYAEMAGGGGYQYGDGMQYGQPNETR